MILPTYLYAITRGQCARLRHAARGPSRGMHVADGDKSTATHLACTYNSRYLKSVKCFPVSFDLLIAALSKQHDVPSESFSSGPEGRHGPGPLT